MKVLQRTLAILASLFLVVQTVRHVYVRWLEPRASVLDKYEKPLKDEIEAATSVEDLLVRYEPLRKDVDRVKVSEGCSADPKVCYDNAAHEPFKSEQELREAIQSWESRAKDIHALRFYWLVGLVLVGVGAAVSLKANHWVGLTLLIVGFSEMVYWTCPTFWGVSTREFDRLLEHKLALSALSVVLLGVTVRVLGVFQDDRR